MKDLLQFKEVWGVYSVVGILRFSMGLLARKFMGFRGNSGDNFNLVNWELFKRAENF